MEDKVVLVTGSSSGIGRSSVVEFAKLGCKVVVHGTNESNVNSVADECLSVSPKGYKPLEIICDIRDMDQVKDMMDTIIEHHGQLDVLVNNAGIFKSGHVDDTDAYERFREMISINLDQVVLVTTLAVPHLKKSRGNIVNVSSNLHSKCLDGAFSYSTAKAGLTMFTKSIAVDLAPVIRVNSVSPGPIATQMASRNGMSTEEFRQAVSSSCLVERVGEPGEVARIIVFLASPESSYITGSDFVIDGGSSIKPSGKIMGQT